MLLYSDQLTLNNERNITLFPWKNQNEPYEQKKKQQKNQPPPLAAFPLTAAAL